MYTKSEQHVEEILYELYFSALEISRPIIACTQFDSFWTEVISLCQQEDFLQLSISAIYPALQTILEHFAKQRKYVDNVDKAQVQNVMLMHYAPANFFSRDLSD